MKLKEFILIRHGQTEYNRKEQFLGHTDLPLNDEGVRQARSLALRLKDEVFEMGHVSDLVRCKQTFELLDLKCGVRYSPNLREINVGEWEGLTYEDIRGKFTDELAAWQDDWINKAPPGGESFREMSVRVLDEFERIRTGTEERAVIVAHGGSIRAIIAHYITRDLKDSWRFLIDNGSITRLCFNKDFAYLKSLNEK